jgi:hypothetical protein
MASIQSPTPGGQATAMIRSLGGTYLHMKTMNDIQNKKNKIKLNH